MLTINSIDATASCDVCGKEVQLELKTYRKLPTGHSDYYMTLSADFMHDQSEPSFTLREFNTIGPHRTKQMVCKRCCELLDSMRKNIDREHQDQLDNLLNSARVFNGFKPPEGDPYYA